MISTIIFIPTIALLFFLIFKNIFNRFCYYIISIISIIIQLLLEIIICVNFIIQKYNITYSENIKWFCINILNKKIIVYYHVAVDGINLPIIILCSLITIISIVLSYNVEYNYKLYLSLILIINVISIGYFCAMDLILFYIFYELMLIPIYLLIILWGNKNRSYSATKFAIYTIGGSLMLLMGIIILYYCKSFNNEIISLAFNLYNNDNIINTINLKIITFTLFFISLGIKSAIFPFHNWLPNAHVSACTPVSIILSSITLKTGVYGMIRLFYYFLYDQILYYKYITFTISLITFIYGIINIMIKNDLKAIIAYSSISHMGFILLGVLSGSIVGLTGSIISIISHSILSAMLFIICDIVYFQTNSRNINHFKGLILIMPCYTYITILTFFAGIGMPGFSLFIGKLLTMIGLCQYNSFNTLLYILLIIIVGFFLNAVCFFLILKKMFFGNIYLKGGLIWEKKLNNYSNVKTIILIFLLLILLLLGIMPFTIINMINNTIVLLYNELFL